MMRPTHISIPSAKVVAHQPKSFNKPSYRNFHTKLNYKSKPSAQIYSNTYNNTRLVSCSFVKQPTRTFLGSLFSSKQTGGPFQTIQPGLEKSVIQAGDGKTFPQKGQTVVVDYVSYADGKKYDGSRDANGDSFRFVIGYGQVIKGWDEGVATMSVGEKAIFKVAPELGYGEHGFLGIPANAKLEFEIHLINVLQPPKDNYDAVSDRFPKVFPPRS